MFACVKIAEKVGCTQEEHMTACLKMTDPVALTMAGKVALSEMGKGCYGDAPHQSLFTLCSVKLLWQILNPTSLILACCNH